VLPDVADNARHNATGQWISRGLQEKLSGLSSRAMALSVLNGHDQDCAWVHAYLHRVEGDLDNANYWYRQARRKPATHELASEWDEIVAALLGHRR
jgi:hypothetical protein